MEKPTFKSFLKNFGEFVLGAVVNAVIIISLIGLFIFVGDLNIFESEILFLLGIVSFILFIILEIKGIKYLFKIGKKNFATGAIIIGAIPLVYILALLLLLGACFLSV